MLIIAAALAYDLPWLVEASCHERVLGWSLYGRFLHSEQGSLLLEMDNGQIAQLSQLSPVSGRQPYC